MRRLWIDAPYVLPKALLIDAVARANRCRAVLLEQIGCSTVIGHPQDLAAVELLSTSLLVQANAAMLRCGQQADCQGVSRTTSFRRAFLVSYATRIGERLRAADHRAVHECSRSGKLVPVLAPTEPSRSPPLRTSSSRIRRHGRPTSATHAAGSRGERRQTWRASMSGMPCRDARLGAPRRNCAGSGISAVRPWPIG